LPRCTRRGSERPDQAFFEGCIFGPNKPRRADRSEPTCHRGNPPTWIGLVKGEDSSSGGNLSDGKGIDVAETNHRVIEVAPRDPHYRAKFLWGDQRHAHTSHLSRFTAPGAHLARVPNPASTYPELSSASSTRPLGEAQVLGRDRRARPRMFGHRCHHCDQHAWGGGPP